MDWSLVNGVVEFLDCVSSKDAFSSSCSDDASRAAILEWAPTSVSGRASTL